MTEGRKSLSVQKLDIMLTCSIIRNYTQARFSESWEVIECNWYQVSKSLCTKYFPWWIQHFDFTILPPNLLSVKSGSNADCSVHFVWWFLIHWWQYSSQSLWNRLGCWYYIHSTWTPILVLCELHYHLLSGDWNNNSALGLGWRDVTTTISSSLEGHEWHFHKVYAFRT